MPRKKCPYEKNACEFKGVGICPFPNEFEDDNCMYYTHPCQTCSLRGNQYKRFGDPESGVMIVGGSNQDSPVEFITNLLDTAANELQVSFPYYYTTAIKCVTDKKPTLALIKRCNSFLKEEIKIIKPKYVLVVGETAFKALLLDFDLNTRRKPEIDSCVGSHINRDGIVYLPVHDLKSVEEHSGKQYALKEHIKKFIRLATGELKIAPVHYKEIADEKDLIYIREKAKSIGRVAVDIETHLFTPFLPESEILTVSFTVKEKESFCIPLSFRTGAYFNKWNFTPNVNPLLSILYIREILENPDVIKIFHNASFDIMWLEHVLDLEVKNYDDTMIMRFLMNQNDKDRKGLKFLTKQYLDMGNYEYNIKQYVGPGEPYSNIPPKMIMEYNNADTDATLRLWNIFKPMMANLQLEGIHYGFMIPKLRGIINLQKTGIAIDTNRCIDMKAEYEDKLIELYSGLRALPQVAKFERQTGMEFSPTSDKHKFAVVYGGEVKTEEERPRKIVKGKKVGKKEHIKVYYNSGFNLEDITVSTKNTKTGKREQRTSFGKKAIQKYLKGIYKDVEYLDPINTFNLESLPGDTDIMKFIKLVSEIGSIQTQLSNHITPFIDIWSRTVDGCVHTSYDPTGTATGRLASRAPNLQNLTRDGFVKEAFVSRWGDDGILLEADYKQLELFVMAIVSQDPKFIHAFTHDIDLHIKTAANIVFRCAEDAVSKQMRTMAKTVNFGMIYGKTAYTLKDDLNVTEEEAERILVGYFREYSGVKAYCDKIKSQARSQGFVTTIMGRKRYLDYSDPNGADRQAVNTTIQSPASDVCVTAVNQLQEYFIKVENDRMARTFSEIDRLNNRAREEVAVVCGTVHDSVIIDCKKKYVNEIVQASQIIMENTGMSWVTVPLKVDIKFGANLRGMKDWEPGTEIRF
jgi:uracil-DNA glycosylase family 4